MHLFLLLLALLASSLAEANLSSPNVSANALLLYTNSNFSKHDTDTVRNGLDIQEAELDFYSDVDPYSRLNMILTIHPTYTLNTTTNKVAETWTIEPEELYAESGVLPNTTLKAGKFKAAFGKANAIHSHAQPFVDAPIANSNLLGSEGINDVGVSAAYLFPTPWFNEITAQFLRGEDSNAEFNSPTPNDGIGLLHWKNLLDINNDLTGELGASYVEGLNASEGRTKIAGADLTFKWRPAEGGRYKSWILGLEYIGRRVGQVAAITNSAQKNKSVEKGDGWSFLGQYQFAERWATALRYETLMVRGADSATNSNVLPNDLTTKYSGALIFEATEFSSFRIEFNRSAGPTVMDNTRIEDKIYAQANFTIGAHPAHSY